MKRVAQAIGRFVREEFILSFMLAVVLVVFAFSMVPSTSVLQKPDDALGESARVETTRQLKSLGDDIAREMKQNPAAFYAFSLGFGLFVLAGVAVDLIFLLMGWWRTIFKSREDYLKIPWFVIDVFKVTIVLFFSELVLFGFAGLFEALRFAKPNLEGAEIMAASLARNIVVAFYIFYLIRRRYGGTLAALGITSARWVSNVVNGVIAYTGFFPVYLALMLGIGYLLKALGIDPPVQTVVQIFFEEENVPLIIAFSLFIALAGPFFEEILFRGFIYQAFRKKWPEGWTAVGATSLVFAVMHAHWVAFVPIFFLSVMLCLLYERTRSLVACTTFHMVHNLIALVLMLQLKGFAPHG